MEQKPNPAIRFFPSLADAAFLAPLVLLFGTMGGAKALLGDGDTGWHLRTGEWILAHGRVPTHDMFSFTKAGQPWFAWEWLWDVIFGWLHLHGGMAAVIFGCLVVLCISSLLLYRLVLRRCGNEIVAIAATALAINITAMHWLARPHLVSFLFIMLFYTVLERSREGSTPGRGLWVLPVLMILWTNLHGGFVVGIAFILAYAAGDLATALVEQQEARKATLARSRTYFLVAAATAAATVVNPYGLRLHLHIYSYLTDKFLFEHIQEFLPFSFGGHGSLLYEGMFLLGAMAIYASLVRKDFAPAFLLLGWGHEALVMRRGVPIFALAAAPLVAALVAERLRIVGGWAKGRMPALVEAVTTPAAEFCTMERIGRWHLASALGLVAVALPFFSPAPPASFRPEYDPKRFPVAAVDYLTRAGLTQRVFANDIWGGYLIYRTYPEMKVFVDGRSDFYGAKFDETFIDVLNVKYDWQKQLDRYNVETALLPVGAPLVGALKESSRWRVVYDDGRAIVFRSVAAEAAAHFPAAVAGSGLPSNPDMARP